MSAKLPDPALDASQGDAAGVPETDAASAITTQSPWRSRVVRARKTYHTTLAKSQAFHEYQFPTLPTVTISGTDTLNQPIKVAEQVDVNAKIDVFEKKEHAAPLWLRTVSGYSWRLIILAVAIAIVVYGLSHVGMVIASVFVALVFTAGLRPIRLMFDRRMKRGWAVLCTMLTAILTIGAIITFVVFSVIDSWAHLDVEMSDGIERLFDLLRRSPLHINIPWEHAGDALSAGQEWISTHSGRVLSDVWSNVGRGAEIIIYTALAIFLTVWFLSSGMQMWQWLLSQFPASTRDGWRRAFSAGFTTFSGYARGAVLVALCDGVLAAILLFAMRIPVAAPLAVLVFIGALIPMVGAPAAMVVAGVVALITRGPIAALVVILGVALIGQIEGHVLQPFIMGKQVKLHPVVVALSVAIGAIVAGIFGAILAVPVVAVGWSIYKALRPARPSSGSDDGTVVATAASDPALIAASDSATDVASAAVSP